MEKSLLDIWNKFNLTEDEQSEVMNADVLCSEFDGLHPIDQLNMDWCPFWVQIHGLPVKMMTKKVGIVVAETLGDMEELDMHEGSLAWGRFMRVKVLVSVTKALKRGTMVPA
ncbi:hypothetical protein REPUB_Repub01dG0097600 [Reevesia pubescens]